MNVRWQWCVSIVDTAGKHAVKKSVRCIGLQLAMDPHMPMGPYYTQLGPGATGALT